MTVSEGSFFEEDEPVADVVAAFDAGVARRDWTRGPCEFAIGEVRLSPAPVIELCGQPGTMRKGVMWCGVYVCDACYARWRGRRSRVNGDEDAC